MTPGRAAISMARSTISSGATHTGQPGPCTSSISGGSSSGEAVAHDGVGLAAADFHQHPGPGDPRADARGQRARHAGVAILVQVLHRRPPRRRCFLHLAQQFVGAFGFLVDPRG